jgi:TetR/AcrR family transcriptional regulator, fatty acid biosynthesis regulator
MTKETSASKRETRSLSRAESKELTRRRLLNSAMALLSGNGGDKLSVSAISRHAGIAQSSFYVHFRDLDDLLQVLGDELAVRRSSAVREARRRVREQPSAERVRDTFRIPLEQIIRNPDEYRAGLRVRFDPDSPLGSVVRDFQERERQDLVEDLVLAGYTVDTPREYRGAEMVAECLATMTEVLARGNLDGRYPDVDEILDVLVQIFFSGVASFFNPDQAE